MAVRACLAALALPLAACGGPPPSVTVVQLAPAAEATSNAPALAATSPPAAPQPARLANAVCAPDALVDDMEDGDGRILVDEGRGGYWFTYADKRGTTISPATGAPVSMSAGGADGSTYAARMSGSIASGAIAFAGMGFNFAEPRRPYDASMFVGISFSAMVAPGSLTSFRLSIADGDTEPDGKICKECFNHFGADLELTSTWALYTIPFASMQQLPGWGVPRPPAIDTRRLYSVAWQATTPGASYDLWVDNVKLVGCGDAASGRGRGRLP